MARNFAAASSQYLLTGGTDVVGPQAFTTAGWYYEATRVSGGGDPAAAHMLYSSNHHLTIAQFNEISSDNGVLKIAYADFGWNDTGITLSLTTWTHIAVGADATNYDVYINGGASSYNTSSKGFSPQITPVVLGAWSGHAGTDAVTKGYFNGIIAELAVWNVKLTVNELRALTLGARPYMVRPANLKGYFPLYGIASPEPDLSGLAKNATSSSFPTLATMSPPIGMFTPRWPRNYDVAAATVPLSQTHYRFRSDGDAVDATPTWPVAEDANGYNPDVNKFRIRIKLEKVTTA